MRSRFARPRNSRSPKPRHNAISRSASVPWRIAASAGRRCRRRAAIIATAFSSSVRIARAGAPTISELSGKVLPSVTSAPAPTSEFLPILRAVEQDRAHADQAVVADDAAVQHDLVADHAIARRSPSEIPDRCAAWRCPGSASARRVSIHSLSPRSTAPNQMLEWLFMPDAADQHRGLGHPVAAVGRKLRRLSVEFINRHCASSNHGGDLAMFDARRNDAEKTTRPDGRWPAAPSPRRVPDIRLQKPATTAASAAKPKLRPSTRRPRTVLRTMMKGAANTRNGTAASARVAFGLVQQLEARRLHGQELIAAGQQPGDRKADRQRQERTH